MPLGEHIGAPSPWASDSVSPISAVGQHEFMTINPDTLVSKSFSGKEPSQGCKDGHPSCVGGAD